jgi:NitT/TauT family transport system substrate-binding protein
VDVSSNYASSIVSSVAGGSDVEVLAGIHGGCVEIFARPGIESIADLRGKTVAMGKQSVISTDGDFLTSILRYVGLTSEVNFQEESSNELLTALSKGRADAVVALPPINLQLRDQAQGHVILNSMKDRPWSDHFCCMVIANRDFVRNNPRATAHTLRAIIRAEQACIDDPQSAAQTMYEFGGTTAEYGLEIAKSIPYGAWRTYDPEDSLRFAALQLREAGEIKVSPEDIVKRTGDWRFLEKIKREMPIARAPLGSKSNGMWCDSGEAGEA